MTEQKSALVEWLEARPRWHKDVDICGAGLQNHDGSPVGKIRFWVNSKADDNDAILCAYRETERLAKKFTESAVNEARRDPDFLEDLKTVHALWRACRNPDNDQPVFPSPEWIVGEPGGKPGLNGHAIGYLLNLYNSCKLEEAHIAGELDRARVEAYRDGCVAVFDSTLPEQLLAPLPREQLMRLALMAMKHWHDDVAALTARIEELERATGYPGSAGHDGGRSCESE